MSSCRHICIAFNGRQIPENLEYDDAATIPLGFDTASTGLYSDVYGIGLTPPWAEGGFKKYSGNPIVIMGGSSSVGSYGKLRGNGQDMYSTSLF
jgi:NADPH:quinone reductase-like Zn-dependent oxidoreductase